MNWIAVHITLNLIKRKKGNYFDIDKLLSVVGFVNKNGQ